MAQPFRLAQGGRIDRGVPLSFTFDGRPIEAYAGDTVASALLANGVRLFARSFKYHRPRGVLSHGSDEPSALVTVDRGKGRSDPNNRATVIEVTDGMAVRSQNRWPSLHRDFGAINDRLAPFFAAGFYYKTFMWPRAFWRKLYEPAIRAMAGLGEAPGEPDADRYGQRHAHCEVLIVGAGPAGLAAALAASETNQRVILCDEQSEPGGTLLHEPTAVIEGVAAQSWLSRTLALLRARDNVTVLPRTTAFGYYNHNHIALVERLTDHIGAAQSDLPRERLWQVRARRVVLASGALERPLLFSGNDRPGIMLAESVRVMINRYGVTPGRRIVIAANNASACRVAADIAAAGVEVFLVDERSVSAVARDVEALDSVSIEVFPSSRIVGSSGRRAVRSVSIVNDAGVSREIACDCVGMAGGWTPSVHLFSQSRGGLAYDDGIGAFVPGPSKQVERTAGAARGTYDLAHCIEEGWAAGRDVSPPASGTARAMRAPRSVVKTESGRAFIDFQNDVTTKDIRLALREGFESIEHLKRYTTTGMATDQGKTSNMLALELVADALGRPVADVGTTTFRPPYTPVTFGAIAGEARGMLLDPVRKAPMHDWAAAQGARFENVGLWQRAWYFPKAGENLHDAVMRECRAVRNAAGIFDASTLGKIEVVGPDAAEFLNRIYINSWNTLEPGRCRYGLMLKEDGYVFDDGVVARMEGTRFHVTTTTGGAARVMAHMEDYLQTEWPELDVFLTSTTEQWAVIAVHGPRARAIVEPLVEDIDFSNFAYMAARTGKICGVGARIFRVSFTGEPGYEINVPASRAQEIWDAVWSHGTSFGLTPYGTEAMHVLRAERGFIIPGQETDGTVTPDDLGLSRMIARSKRDFVGKRSLARPDLVAPGRKQLVGLLSEDVLDEGAQVVRDRKQSLPMTMLGHVTSSYFSASCGHPIALALVAGGRNLDGQVLHVTSQGGFASAKVVGPVFFDPEGTRAHG